VAVSEWDNEYSNAGVPTSTETKPSGSVSWFENAIGNDQFKSLKRGLDLGCGKGRNAIAFASSGIEMVGVDASQVAIELAEDAAHSLGASFVLHDITKPLPFDDKSFDFVLDSYVTFHLVHPTDRQNCLKEIRRILRPRAWFVSTAVIEGDSYYSACPDEPGWQNWSKVRVVRDPGNGITVSLFAPESLSVEYSEVFELEKLEVHSDCSLMYGKEYERKNLYTLWRVN
jgi:SAM-dependent methyltransferase